MNVFFSYSHQDEALREELEAHLAPLRREGRISAWHDRRITAGQDWAQRIDESLERADVILLLVSPSFVASDYCWEIEVRRAMERHEAGEARVIPILLRPTDWHSAPFGKLQALPRDARPVTAWPDRDAALLDVAQGLRAAIDELEGRAAPAPAASTRPSAGGSQAADPVNREAAALWREKLGVLLKAEALETDPARKFALEKQIEEAKAKLREL